MPVPVDNIEKQIEKITEILNSKIVVYTKLQEASDYLAVLLGQKKLLSTEYFYPLEKLIKLFDEKDIIIPKELHEALSNVLLEFDYYFDNLAELRYCDNLKELAEVIENYLEIVGAAV